MTLTPTAPLPTPTRAFLPPPGTPSGTPSSTPSLSPCRDEHHLDLWFAEKPQALAIAQALCGGCALSEECLAGALERREPWGVWGGRILVDGAVVAVKRGRGRPPRSAAAERPAG